MEEETKKYGEDIEFINLLAEYHVYPYPHPEPITLPMYIEGVNDVNGAPRKIRAFDFATSYLIEQREKILEEKDIEKAKGW